MLPEATKPWMNRPIKKPQIRADPSLKSAAVKDSARTSDRQTKHSKSKESFKSKKSATFTGVPVPSTSEIQQEKAEV